MPSGSTATSEREVPDRNAAPATPPRPRKRTRRITPFWAKQLHMWHWMSSAICLVGMLLFAVTGITLNHAGSIGAEPKVVSGEQPVPQPVLDALRAPGAAESRAPVPKIVAGWAADSLGLSLAGRPAERSEGEVYVPLQRPGGDGWVAFDTAAGTATWETSDRGWIAYLNDLHKGRDTGTAWRWFIDIFAAACVIFSLTGFFLLTLHARHRRSTWPLVIGGLVGPVLLIVLLVHS